VIWFHLIEVQFCLGGYQIAKAQVCQCSCQPAQASPSNNLDTVDACNESDQPFDDRKTVLLGQYAKSKWRSYFELLRLLLDKQGLKPIILMHKLKQSLLRRGPRSFTIRVGSRDEVVAVSRFKACTAAEATPGSPRRRGRPPGSRPGGLTATKRFLFSDPLVSSPSSSSAPPRDGPGTVFLPGEEVFAHPGPAAPSQLPQTRYPSRQRTPPKRLDL
jgi:hypothetical protein